jgi:two-component system sensor histidine kinase/response regulator
MTSQQPLETRLARRVLVADDDPFYREIASASLMEAGLDVVTAADGREALEVFASAAPDLAIVDVLMPELSGLEFLNQVRTSGSSRHVPVIVITGHDDTESIQRAYDAGATSFLAKPLNWPLFVQHVNFVLKAGQADADLRDAIRTAEFLSDLKSRVVSVLVGEFQAPLRTAQGMSELLRKEVYGPLGHRLYGEYAEDLHKALDQLNSIQLKMMNSSRVMSAELLLKEEEIPLRECVVDAIHSMRAKADRRGIDIELRDSLPRDLMLKGDRSLISQAFKLLIEGAIAASPRNSQIVLDARLDQEGAFSLSIEDMAPAMPEQMVRDVLGTAPVARPIAQQLTTSRNTSLTISRVVMEAHDGRMLINSTMGEGTIVRLTLPMARLASASLPGRQPAMPALVDAGPPPVRSSVPQPVPAAPALASAMTRV